MTAGEAALVAALVSSSPGWAALYVTNRRALRKQTAEFRHFTAEQTKQLKAHLDASTAAPPDERSDPRCPD